ncbi:MAG: hypothetical protein ACFFE5_03750 [Candidatus Thorarchaeota archaeon]
MIEKFLVLSYFDMYIGPNILYSNIDISNIYGFPDLSRILEFSEVDDTFIFSFRKFQTINTIFYMKSNIARGGEDLLMISGVIRASYFKNELTDIYKYLETKKKFLEKFASELKLLPNFNLILHKYKQNPTIKQFKEYCEEFKIDFLSIYDRFFDLIFPESEIRIITQDIALQKKILLLGPKGSGKDTFLRSIEELQFNSQSKLDIPTRILGIIIDNIILSNVFDFLNGKVGLDIAQAIILLIKSIDKKTCDEVNLLIEKFISSYSSQKFGKVPLLIINNLIKDKTPLREIEIKKNISNLKRLKKEKIPIKYYSLNVLNKDPILLEPLKWLIKEIFT